MLSDWVVLFDAVGTLIEAVPDVYSVYHRTAQQFGSRISIQEIKSRFTEARQIHFHNSTVAADCRAGQLLSNDAIEREKWKKLVRHVMHDVEPIEMAFRQLWNHFALAEHWRVFPDVADCWQQLKEHGARMAIASNFDSRLVVIVQQFAPLADCDHVFYSAEVGYLKPDPQFYRTVANHFVDTRNQRIAMAGDHWQNDVEGPRRMGWTSFHLCRQPMSPNGPTDYKTAPTIRSLAELPPRLDAIG